MKRRIRVVAAIAAGVLTILTAGGCDLNELSFDDTLRPPKTMGDEAEIEKLISQSADSDYILKYPKSGAYRSAIIMNDLDGDDIDEAVAFFKKKNANEGIHMLVMHENEGEWSVSGDITTESTDVDCVDFSDIAGENTLEIIVGYSTFTPNVNFLSCFSYSKGEITPINSGQNYSSFRCGDIDRNGKNEIVTLSLYTAENPAKAALLGYNKEKKSLVKMASAPMDPNVVRFKSINLGDLGNSVKGMAVDGSYSGGETVTQVIFYSDDDQALKNPLYSEKAANVTKRICPVVCGDIENDLIIEIPTVTKMPEKSGEGDEAAADRLTWNNFDTANETLVPKYSVAANYTFGYTIRISDNWIDGYVTAVTDDSNGLMGFYECDPGSAELGGKLFEVKVFNAETWNQGKNNDGYTLIYKDNRYAYTFENIKENSDFSVTDEEIKTAFSVLNEISL